MTVDQIWGAARSGRIAATLNRGGGGRAPALVLLHGSPGSHHDWDPFVASIDAGLAVLAPDRPGYGQSTDLAPAAQTIGGNAAELAAALDDMGFERSIVVGHSFGGGVALSLAIDFPHLVSRLVLVSSIGTRSAILPSDRLSSLPVLGEALTFAMFRGLGRLEPHLLARLASAGGPAPPSEFVENALRHAFRMRGAWRTYLSEQRSMIADTPAIEGRLGEVAAPSLIVWGAGDRLVPRTAVDELVELLPDSRLEVVEGAGHSVPQERPAELARLVESFLD